MDEEFPSNSARPAKKANKENPDDKKIERVIEGKVTRRKKSLGKKFKETFVSGDAQSVGGYVFWDVIIPAAKDTIADAMTTGVERMLFGESSRSRGRSGSRSSGSGGFVNYGRYGSGSARRDDSRGRPDISRKARANHEFDELTIESRGEAETVLDTLYDLLSRYHTVTVSDLYDLVGITGNAIDERWGWTDLSGSGVSRTRYGYILDLPKPEPL